MKFSVLPVILPFLSGCASPDVPVSPTVYSGSAVRQHRRAPEKLDEKRDDARRAFQKNLKNMDEEIQRLQDLTAPPPVNGDF